MKLKIDDAREYIYIHTMGDGGKHEFSIFKIIFFFFQILEMFFFFFIFYSIIVLTTKKICWLIDGFWLADLMAWLRGWLVAWMNGWMVL